MKYLVIGAAAAALLSTAAFAQSATTTHAHNPVVKDSSPAPVHAPAAGRNSFTEDQARGRLTKAGYASISKLAKDQNGVWRGMAMHHGKKVHVGLDYKGNVTSR